MTRDQFHRGFTLYVSRICAHHAAARSPPGQTLVQVSAGLPAGCIWPVSTTTFEDRERFFGSGAASRVHVIEAGGRADAGGELAQHCGHADILREQLTHQ